MRSPEIYEYDLLLDPLEAEILSDARTALTNHELATAFPDLFDKADTPSEDACSTYGELMVSRVLSSLNSVLAERTEGDYVNMAAHGTDIICLKIGAIMRSEQKARLSNYQQALHAALPYSTAALNEVFEEPDTSESREQELADALGRRAYGYFLQYLGEDERLSVNAAAAVIRHIVNDTILTADMLLEHIWLRRNLTDITRNAGGQVPDKSRVVLFFAKLNFLS